MSCKVFLTVDTRRKHIPYQSETHDGSQNFGFKILKGKLHKIDSIQEAKGFPGIIHVLRALNESNSPFFSIGCEKYIGEQPFSGFYARGYIEFSFNYAIMANFANLAEFFRMFSIHCANSNTRSGDSFDFNMQPAHFKKIGLDGYSCCVWIRTGEHSSYSEAEQSYNRSAIFLAKFIETVGAPASLPEAIY